MKHIICLLAINLMFIMFGFSQSNENKGTETITFDFSKPDSVTTTQNSNGSVVVVGHDRNKAYYQKKVKQAKKKMVVGIVLSSLGAAVLAGTIGGYFALKNKNKTAGYSAFRDGGLLLQFGVPGSAVLMGIGIPLSIVGAKKVKKYEKKLQAF